MKTCKGCGEDKPLTEFHKNTYRCKLCERARYAAYRLANLERLRAYDRDRSAEPERMSMTASLSLAYKMNHPDRAAATSAVARALRSGELVKWPVCAVPDCECTSVQAHHPDYSRPLDVIWLCAPHHKHLHVMAKRLEEEREKENSL